MVEMEPTGGHLGLSPWPRHGRVKITHSGVAGILKAISTTCGK